MLDSYIAIVTHPMLILFLTMCAVAYLFLALISLPKDGERHWADLKRPFFAKLGLSDLPTPILLLGIVIWGMLFAVFGFGLFWVVWKLIMHEPPNLAGAVDDKLRWSLLTLTAMTASLSAVVALPFTLLRLQFTGRQTEATEQGLITDRINKAVEGLGAEKSVKTLFETPRYRVDENKNWRRDDNGDPTPALRPDGQPIVDRQTLETTEPNLEVRIGAILSLERISQDSARDHIQIMEILCAYIRENVAADAPDLPTEDLTPNEWRKWGDKNRRQPRLDIDIALKVIERRSPERKDLEAAQTPPYRLGLERSPLWAIDLSGRDLTSAILTDAQLHGVDLSHSKLCDATLSEAKLQGANLGHAEMQNADLRSTTLNGAYFGFAKMQGANLTVAKLHCAFLSLAQLQSATLSGAEFNDSRLNAANFKGAELEQVDLHGTALVSTELQGAILNGIEMTGKTKFTNAKVRGALLLSSSFESGSISQIQLNSTFGDRTVSLPDELTYPDHWNKDDPPPERPKLIDEWRAWQRDVLRMNPDGTDMDADPDAP